MDFGLARVIQHLSGGKLLDHMPPWFERPGPKLTPADDMIMKMRGLAAAWKVKRLNEEVESGRSSKRPRGTDNRRRDEPPSRDDASVSRDEGV